MVMDFHMHSDFSADCTTPMEATIQAAIQKGLTEICFTEHVDYEYPDPTIDFVLDLSEYDAKIRQFQKQYEGQISIKKGIEIGVQPHLLERYEKLLNKETFDFIICSIHTADKKDLHSGNFFKHRTPEAAYQLYYEELLYCVEHFNDYNILGHLDLVKRYQKLDSKADFHEVIEQIFRTIIPKGKGIEVNTSGFSYGLDQAMPSDDILRLYKACGGEVITLGSDAHYADHVGRHFTETLQLLDRIGFKYVTSFHDKIPTFHPIKQLL